MDSLGIDATYHIPASEIKASGYSFVGRYCLEGAYRIDSGEVADYLSHGLGIQLFGEHSADFMLGGAPAGREAGADVAAFLPTIEAPPDTAVFYTCDFDAQPNQFSTLSAFLLAAQGQMAPGRYRAGIYGGFNVVEALSGYPSVQTEAWSYGRISNHANFFQRVGTTLPPISGQNYDEQIAINPVGLWGGSVQPIPPTKEDLMFYTYKNDDGTEAFAREAQGYLIPLDPLTAYAYRQAGIPEINLTNGYGVIAFNNATIKGLTNIPGRV